MSDSLQPCQAPLSMGFPRQEYWNGLPFPSPEYLPDPGIEPSSLSLQADSLPSELPGKPKMYLRVSNSFSRNYFKIYIHYTQPCVCAALSHIWHLVILLICKMRIFQDFPSDQMLKNLPANAGDSDFILSPIRPHMLQNNQAHVPRAYVPPQDKSLPWEAQAQG